MGQSRGGFQSRAARPVSDTSRHLSQLMEPLASVSSLIESKNGSTLKEILSEIEKEVLLVKVRQLKGNVQLAAKELMISKTALYDKLKRYDINPKELRWGK